MQEHSPHPEALPEERGACPSESQCRSGRPRSPVSVWGDMGPGVGKGCASQEVPSPRNGGQLVCWLATRRTGCVQEDGVLSWGWSLTLRGVSRGLGERVWGRTKARLVA